MIKIDLSIDEWLKFMNYWLEIGNEKGYVVYDVEKWEQEESYEVIRGFNKSDVFMAAVWFDKIKIN